MYSDKISVFENFQSEPKTISLGQWLKVCKQGSRFTEQVLQYRRSGEQYLKTSLPLATVGALCKGGRKLENVVTPTGWIALDIDTQDNPHLTDAKHLRNQVSNISNVAFSGLSVSGKGVWALIKVKYPKKQAEHFEMILRDFKSFGITLDTSKGKNPNDARFYSYDPSAIIKNTFTIYEKLPSTETGTIPKVSVHPSEVSKYAEAALVDELKILKSTQTGKRNNQLFKSAASLAEMIAVGMLNESDVRNALMEAALSIGLKKSEINKTIDSGFNTGFRSPRIFPIKIDDAMRAKSEKSRFNEIQETRHPNLPEDWDEVELPETGTTEFNEMTYYELMDKDPMLKKIYDLFDCEFIDNTKI